MNTTKLAKDAELEKEQSDIQKAIHDWRAWWNEVRELGHPHFGEMAIQLHNIVQQLREHFDHEESTGYLKRIAAGQPDQQQIVQRLTDDHRQLIAALEDLIHTLRNCDCYETSWGEASRRFEAVLDRLKRHENEEAQWAKL